MTNAIAPTDAYLALIRRFRLRPLASEEDALAAIAVLDELTDRKDLAPEELEYLGVLMRLVKDYESATDPIAESSPVAILRFLLEENNLTQAQLAEQAGIAVATLSEILNGKRGISPKVRNALARRFRADPSLFV